MPMIQGMVDLFLEQLITDYFLQRGRVTFWSLVSFEGLEK